MSLTPARFHKVTNMAKKLVYLHNAHKRFVSFRLLKQFLGVAVSTFEAIQLARLCTHTLFSCCTQYERRYKSVFHPKWGAPGKRVKLNKAAFKELLFWANVPLT